MLASSVRPIAGALIERTCAGRFCPSLDRDTVVQPDDTAMKKQLPSKLARLTIVFAAIAVATCLGTSSVRAYGDAPWCAVINIGAGTVYWDCQYRTVEECVPNVIAGNRGFCNLNPWPGPSQVVPYKHQKRHPRY